MAGLQTALCGRLGIEYPILSVGFGVSAGPDLVCAVSDAGGCGVLGGSGYKRYRDAEFGSRDIPRADLLREIDAALAAVQTGLARVSDDDLKKPFPEAIGGVTPTTGAWLAHLAVHLGYHLGQVDYHRRMISREGKTVGALPVGELKP